MNKPIIIILAVAAVAAGFFVALRPQPVKLPLSRVEIAETAQQQEIGLMKRESLCGDCGMLFAFTDSKPRSFWMRNTKISLDMVFLATDGKIVAIHRRTVPLQLEPQYESKEPAQYVLEINAGKADELGLKEGQMVDISHLYQVAVEFGTSAK